MGQSKAVPEFTILLVIAFFTPPISACIRTFGEYSSPETTLKHYIGALRVGDRDRAAMCFYPPAVDFYLPQPIVIKDYAVRKKIVYGESEVTEWNTKGIIPAARVGDVELQVEEIRYGDTFMFSYNFRKIDGEWKIISHGAQGNVKPLRPDV